MMTTKPKQHPAVKCASFHYKKEIAERALYEQAKMAGAPKLSARELKRKNNKARDSGSWTKFNEYNQVVWLTPRELSDQRDYLKERAEMGKMTLEEEFQRLSSASLVE